MMKKQTLKILVISAVLGMACGKQALEDSLEGPIQQNGQAVVNVLDFGADSTGTLDSSPAFESLLAQAAGNRQVEVVIPAGRYRITRPILIDSLLFHGWDFQRGLIIRGAGEDVTELVCDNDEGGIFFDGRTNLFTATIKDLSVVTAREGEGTAISFDNVNPGDHHSRMLQVKDVLIRGTKFSEGYFERGIACYNAWYPAFDGVKITSRYGPGNEMMVMDYGILMEDCYSPLLTNCYIWGNVDYGIAYRNVNTEPEDGIVDKTYVVGANHGVYVDLHATHPDWPEPAFRVTNSHINYKVNGVYLKGIRQVNISHNLFYCSNNAGSVYLGNTDPVSVYESVDINCVHATDVIVSNNHFTEPASPKRIGIHIGPLSGYVSIANNQFNFDALCIRNDSARPSFVNANVYGGQPDFRAGNLTKYADLTSTLSIIEY